MLYGLYSRAGGSLTAERNTAMPFTFNFGNFGGFNPGGFNPGGYQDELVKVLDYLLPEGVIFKSVDFQGNEETEYSDASCVELPMAVLVNEDS